MMVAGTFQGGHNFLVFPFGLAVSISLLELTTVYSDIAVFLHTLLRCPELSPRSFMGLKESLCEIRDILIL